MDTRSVIRGVMITIGVATTVPIPAAARIPETVAPGAPDRVAVTVGRCPTFIWAAVPGAVEHEVVAYRIADDLVDLGTVDLATAQMVLYARVPGGATAWQPELSDCLEPAGTYVWFVRGTLDPDRVTHGEWSTARFFAVPAVPSAADVEEAIRVLRRYHGSVAVSDDLSGGGQPVFESRSRSVGTGMSPPLRSTVGVKSVASAIAAVKAAPSSITGEVYGVVGVTGSADGAGLGAANTVGGADLVLDGVSDGEADARFSQAGLDRPSLSPQVYDVQNSFGGGMTLRVDGDTVVTTLTDQDTPPREAGNQLDLVGNTLDVLEGHDSGLDADTLDGLHASAFANVVHDHHGQTWSGTGSWGLRAESSDGHGLYGRATASNGLVYGVFGQSASDAGRGVYAEATAPSGTTYGVYGRAESTGGVAVFGWADALTGSTAGVKGQSSSVAGHGVWGAATSTTGFNEGVRGQSASSEGRGVYGLASATTGTTLGVLGTSHSVMGRGVMGLADASTGMTYGVLGMSDSSAGTGVFGTADAASGLTYGVSGRSASADGYGGFFVNTGGGVLLAANDAASTSDLEFKVTNQGDVYADGGFHCGNTLTCVADCDPVELQPCLEDAAEADFAEMLPSVPDVPASAGDVVVIDARGRLSPSRRPFDPAVVGVLSTRPSYLGNSRMAGAEDYSPLAIVGVVPVRAVVENGPIRPGDMLVSSSVRGHAMAAGADPPQGTVIGKALEPLDDEAGLIRMIVVLQ